MILQRKKSAVPYKQKTKKGYSDMEKKIFQSPKALPSAIKRNGKAGVITIVNSKKNGKRIEFLPNFCEQLGIDKKVQIAFEENALVVIPVTDKPEYPVYDLKTTGCKRVLYNAALVEEIIEKLQLDYSECVSKTLSHISLEEWGEIQIAVISGGVADEG